MDASISTNGLSEKQALDLKNKFGDNILPVKKDHSWLRILFSQFKSPFIYILVFVSLISVYFEEYADFVLLILVVALNVAMGFYQEYSAQKTLSALSKILKPKAIVIRDGKRKEINVKDLVPGDLIVLGSGDKAPADGKMIQGANLLINEAILTGEEEAVLKDTKENSKIFMGTTVVSGSALAIVEKIGQKTEIGKIGQSLQEMKKEKTPLQIKLEKFSRKLTFVILIVCLIVFSIGVFFSQKDIWEMLKFSIILSVAAIPEGLPIAITVVLTLGMKRILKRNGLVRKLIDIETLGSTSVICTDKTGTLTEGVMRVVKTDFTDSKKALFALILANNQRTNLETCVWDFAEEQPDIDAQEIFNSYPRIYEDSFDSKKKYMMSINLINGKEVSFILGAPEIVLSFCFIPVKERQKALAELDSWADNGLRILGIAIKEQENLKETSGYSWLGLAAIQDPIRKQARQTIIDAKKAGIKVKIVTGDYRKTAERVAEAVGFKIRPKNVLEGYELESISEKELERRIDDILLFTRVLPHQKLKIVKALQKKGEVVAMIGDGVNDALALKKADIGVVMGSGSDVARQSSDLVLLDNDLQTIISACEEGRLVFANIKKVVAYALSNSFAEIVLIFGALITGLSFPLTIIQILWIHLICDGPPDIVLSFEGKDKDLMKQKPKEMKKEGLLDNLLMLLVFAISITAGLISLFFFWYFQNKTNNLNLARTIAFVILGSIDLIYVFAFKDLKKPILKMENFFENRYLFWAEIYGFVLLFLAIYVPMLNKVLGTTPLKFFYWLFPLGVGIVMLVFVEIIKNLRRGKVK